MISTASAPRAVQVVVLLVAIQVAAALVAAGAAVVVLIRGAQLPGATAGLAVLALALAAGLGWAASALLHGGRRWARSPVLSWQFLLGALALAGWSTTPQPWPSLVVLVAGGVVAGLLAPSAVAWTSGAHHPVRGD